ncbi:MAG: hypothetical protein JNL01_08540 [Bdellovibrionales bacterium]|nr:hypothetical protein [Bdellovibrionales bacterium]
MAFSRKLSTLGVATFATVGLTLWILQSFLFNPVQDADRDPSKWVMARVKPQGKNCFVQNAQELFWDPIRASRAIADQARVRAGTGCKISIALTREGEIKLNESSEMMIGRGYHQWIQGKISVQSKGNPITIRIGASQLIIQSDSWARIAPTESEANLRVSSIVGKIEWQVPSRSWTSPSLVLAEGDEVVAPEKEIRLAQPGWIPPIRKAQITLQHPIEEQEVPFELDQKNANLEFRWKMQPQASLDNPFDLEISRTADFSTIESRFRIASTHPPMERVKVNRTIPTLAGDKKWFWRAQGVHRKTSSDVESFRIIQKWRPEPIFPPHSSISRLDQPVSLVWKSSEDMIEYDLELNHPSIGRRILSGSNSFQSLNSLEAGNWTWRIRGKDKTGSFTAWSDWNLFSRK